MAHFAELDEDNKVLRVIVISNNDILKDGVEDEATGAALCKRLLGENTKWVQTSYNNNFRKQYAGLGYTYDAVTDVFIAPQPYPSWTLDENFDWQSPTPMPTDGKIYVWNEEKQQWDQVGE